MPDRIILVECPACQGQIRPEGPCILCDGMKYVTEELAQIFLRNSTFDKGDIVLVKNFSRIVYRTSDNRYFNNPPKEDSEKLLLPVRNQQQGTEYLITGYVFVTLGHILYRDGVLITSGTKRHKLYHLTPRKSGIAQVFQAEVFDLQRPITQLDLPGLEKQ